jgi:hypothetical protein
LHLAGICGSHANWFYESAARLQSGVKERCEVPHAGLRKHRLVPAWRFYEVEITQDYRSPAQRGIIVISGLVFGREEHGITRISPGVIRVQSEDQMSFQYESRLEVTA